MNGWLSLRVPAEDDEWLQNQPVWPWLALAGAGYLQLSRTGCQCLHEKYPINSVKHFIMF